MRARTFAITAILLVSFTMSALTAQAQQLLKREPAMGAMKEGQRVLVDDGTCPKGQVKEVVGGNHTKVGGTKKLERTRNCVPRP
jgi:hypothetical protein